MWHEAVLLRDGLVWCEYRLLCNRRKVLITLQTTSDYCRNADPIRNTLPCQAGYGSCAVTGPPPCPAGGKSIEGRKIGYYQSWNVRDRKCNKVEPQQLNTTGYTHLFYAFASIDPKTFTITPMHPDDEQRMKDFTAMTKSRGLQAWIAIGGFDFSNKTAATHTTW
jgi:chitinase